MFDDDIREAMKPWLSKAEAQEFLDTQPVFDIVEKRFPPGLNRIAWEKVGTKHYREIFPVATGCKKTDEIEARLSAHRECVRRWFESEGVSTASEVIWVGDSTDFGLRMTLGTLIDCFPKLFSLPQHSYALPHDGSWCLNYVMEGELFLGTAEATSRSNRGGHARLKARF